MPSRDPVRMLRCTPRNKYLLLPDELYNNTEKDQEDLNTRYLMFSGQDMGDTHKEIKVGFAERADQLIPGRKIGLSGVTCTPQLFDGTEDINIPILSIPVGLFAGIINPENLPKSALERLYPVDNDTERFKLTKDDVQNGDIVKVKDTELMYVVKDDTKLNSEDGYEIYKAGWAAAVPWTGVTEKPISQNIDDVDPTHFPSSKVVNDLYKYTQNSITTLETNLNTKITNLTNSTNTALTNLENKLTNDINNVVNNVKVNYAKNADTAEKLKTARKIDGVDFDGSTDIRHYGICITAAATAEKVVSLDGFKLVEGARVAVKFNYVNTNTVPTLNVNNTGAKNMVKYGTTYVDPNTWSAGAVVEFIYDGISWCMTSSSGAVFQAGAVAPTNKSILWIDTNTTTGGLKYWNGSSWKHVPVAYT